MNRNELKILKIVFLAASYIIYLMLSFVLSGELSYRFAKEQMGITAYLLLALFFAVGTSIFIHGFLKLARKA